MSHDETLYPASPALLNSAIEHTLSERLGAPVYLALPECLTVRHFACPTQGCLTVRHMGLDKC